MRHIHSPEYSRSCDVGVLTVSLSLILDW